MDKKNYLDETGLMNILQKIKAIFASLVHTHTKKDITDYIVDTELSSTSTNPVENKTIKAEFDLVDDKIQTDIDSLRDELKTYVDEKSPEIDVNHDHDDKYYTEAEIDAKLDEAKQYANNIKNDLLNGAGEAYDTLKELGELIDENVDAIEALESVATSKANKDHNHDEVYEKKEDAELKYDELKVKDWNQNDESANDYIKNRTHWIESGEFTNLIYSTDNLDTDGYINELRYKGYYEDINYKVTLNGTSYIISTMYSGEYECIIMGNGKLVSSMEPPDFFYTDDPFCIVIKEADYDGDYYNEWSVFLKEDVEAPISFKIEEILGDGNIYHTLDDKFIPDTIARTEYVDEKISNIPTPDVSGQINEHNTSETAHEDIRTKISNLRTDVYNSLTIQDIPYSITDLRGDVDPYQWHTPIVYGDGKYVAVGETHFTTSVDGINWETPKLHSHDGDYVKGAYGNGKFVFVSNSNKYGYPITIYTEDCVTWNYIALPTEQPIPVIDIIFENGMFVKLYNHIGEGLSPVSYSTDGINWNFSNPYSYSENEYQAYGTNKIIYKDNKFIIPIFDAPHSADTSRVETEGIVVFKYLILYSTDCINWNEYITQVPVSIELLETDVASERIISVISTDEKCIAISEKRTFYTSTNGLDWVISSNLLPLINYRGNQIQIPWNFITYNSNKHLFVLLFEVFFAYSSDGEIWHASDENSDGVGIYRYIVSGGDKFIAQNTETGIIAFSNDAIDWNFAIPSVNTYYGENKTDSLKEAIGINNVAYMDKEDNEDVPDEPEAVIEVVDPMTATRVGSAADAYKTRQAIESMSVGGSASDITFDNSESGGMSSATNVQDAIVEIGTALGEVYQSFSTAANAIGDALVAKGVSVPEGTSLTDMSELISSNLVNSSSADAIKNALIAKGVSVPDNATLSDMATLITNKTVSNTAKVSLSGSFTDSSLYNSTWTRLITFSRAFGQVPTVTVNCDNSSAFVCKALSVTQTSFVFQYSTTSGIHNDKVFSWSAQANSFV